MAHSSGFLSDRHSPLSSSEPVSGSTSPLVIKPATIMAHKPRSSSMNSNGSMHSNHTRSLSIISLESPRNSIVSLEDGLTRPPRNDSNVSLSSLVGNNGGMTPPLASSRETLRLNHKMMPKVSGTAITSDEDSEAEQRTTFHCKCKRKKSASDEDRTSYIKKDFEFQYGSPVDIHAKNSDRSNSIAINNNTHQNTNRPVLDTKLVHDFTPPPLILDANTTETKDLSDNTISKKIKTVNNKTNSIHQSIYLKKKLMYSKDLQLELLNSNNSMERHVDTRFIETVPSGLRNTRPNLSIQIKDFEKEPIITTLEHQNKLISKLNEKWNKSLMTVNNPGSDEKSISDTNETIVRSRKRSRQYLLGDEDDSYDDYDN